MIEGKRKKREDRTRQRGRGVRERTERMKRADWRRDEKGKKKKKEKGERERRKERQIWSERGGGREKK